MPGSAGRRKAGSRQSRGSTAFLANSIKYSQLCTGRRGWKSARRSFGAAFGQQFQGTCPCPRSPCRLQPHSCVSAHPTTCSSDRGAPTCASTSFSPSVACGASMSCRSFVGDCRLSNAWQSRSKEKIEPGANVSCTGYGYTRSQPGTKNRLFTTEPGPTKILQGDT